MTLGYVVKVVWVVSNLLSFHTSLVNHYHEGILEIANSLLKILLDQMVDKTMVAAMKENNDMTL